MNKYENNNNGNSNQSKREVKTYVDYEIFKGKVRLVREGAAPIVIERDAAIDMAKADGKNLVQIAYNKNDFPHAVCKIIDYGKFKYEQQKRDKAAKKAARAAVADVKEVYFSIRIDTHDLENKIEHIKTFLNSPKTKVKVAVKLTKREMNLLGLAKDLMRTILNALDGIAEFDSNPSFMNGIMSCILKSTK